jgi:hypothetical protein
VLGVEGGTIQPMWLMSKGIEREMKGYLSCAGAGVLGATTTAYLSYQKRHAEEWHDDSEAHLVNWSGTHECNPRHLYQPESVEELEQLVMTAHRDGMRLFGSCWVI